MKLRSLPNLKSTDTVNGLQIVSAMLLIPFLDRGLITREVHSEKWFYWLSRTAVGHCTLNCADISQRDGAFIPLYRSIHTHGRNSRNFEGCGTSCLLHHNSEKSTLQGDIIQIATGLREVHPVCVLRHSAARWPVADFTFLLICSENVPSVLSRREQLVIRLCN